MWEPMIADEAGNRKGNRSAVTKGTTVYRKFAAVILLTLSLLFLHLPQAKAATSDWDMALERISNLYNDYSALQENITLNTGILQKLRKQNNDELKAIQGKLKSTDQVLIDNLKLQADAVRKKHAPLLEKYKTLGQQAAAARKAKDLKNAAVLDLQRNKLKTAVAAAQAEIKAKSEALALARKQTTDKTQPARETLAAISALRKETTSGNKELTAAQRLRTEAHKRYQAGMKQGDAPGAAAGMETSFAQMKIVQALQLKLIGWEKQISALLRAAELKLPK
ncbi:hypothetical protein [Paenibacillus agri]|uniref:Uncharacterized protein n=1 Tax=Paenibacillus agri TaxID=2744309 RepID=A0A850EU31_9BACL|nr:hypothetical protein [Paenibacillus agri]NUU64096.1 hypothetical protein [Paenibacillus agri]